LRLIFATLLINMLAVESVGLCAPKAFALEDATLVVRPDRVLCPLQSTLFGINVHPVVDKPLMSQPDFIKAVRSVGIKSCRFPNGCVADLYNWREPRDGWATVEEFLDFCEAIGAEPYYTLNLQGGTEGLEGLVPESASLDEKIKYKHTAPNPCGNTDYAFDTLKDALDFLRKYTIDRALAGKRPILHYEMGNENWGQSRTDWPPEVYAKTVEVYAKAMRSALEEAKKNHPSLEKLNLYIVAVGYPVMGNNMKLVDTPDRKINVRWTRELNRLYSEKIIDAVQEHFYPYASANGGSLVWVAHNLHNIIYARKGLANKRLNEYRDPEIAYNMPMEHTEWNIKCWGSRFSENVSLKNPGFEDGLTGWTVTGDGARTTFGAARRGNKGLRIILGRNSGPCEVTQVFDCPEKAKLFVAGVWVRTDNPEAVKIQFRQVSEDLSKNAGERQKGEVLGEWSAKVADMWERVVISAKISENTKRLEIVLRADAPTTVYFDEVKLYYTTAERGQVPLSAMTYEQQLFCVDALREMALGGCPRAHLHHLSGDYDCTAMTTSGKPKDLAKIFEFFAGAYGDRLVEADCVCPTFDYYSAANKLATDFNALAPDCSNIPMLGCMASRTTDTLYILLINRTSDRELNVHIDLNVKPSAPKARMRILTGPDIDLPGAELSEKEIEVDENFNVSIQPYAAQIIEMPISP